mmetsp:Transcript_25999/g.52503  ORF Transcript_25999/g.52503 Transcript_25999/m.52503 type:complete len:222 (+) Transcript_25999:304-969(+)
MQATARLPASWMVMRARGRRVPPTQWRSTSCWQTRTSRAASTSGSSPRPAWTRTAGVRAARRPAIPALPKMAGRPAGASRSSRRGVWTSSWSSGCCGCGMEASTGTATESSTARSWRCCSVPRTRRRRRPRPRGSSKSWTGTLTDSCRRRRSPGGGAWSEPSGTGLAQQAESGGGASPTRPATGTHRCAASALTRWPSRRPTTASTAPWAATGIPTSTRRC